MVSVAPALAIRAGAAAGEGPAIPRDREEQEGQQQREPRLKKPKKPQEPRPTHFLALQVSQHPGVTSAIATVQASLARHSPHLKKACVEPASAHLTLGVMALGSEEERARAAGALAALAGPLRDAALLAPVEVELEGLSHFKNQVLYLDVRPGDGLERLAALAAAARMHFQDAGLLLQADRAFVPHVTIAKTSKLQGWGGKRGHGCGGKGHGRGHGGHGHGGHGGGPHDKHDWRAERRGERRAKQQRLEMQTGDDEALASMDWGREPHEGDEDEAAGGAGDDDAGNGNGAASATAGEAAGSSAAAAGTSASAAALPASATEPPSSSMTNNDASTTAAGEAGLGAGVEDPVATAPSGGVQPPGGRKRQHEEAGAGAPGRHGGGSWREIDAEAWAQHVAILGGTVLLGEIQLCAMQGRKPEEYYPVLCSLPLAPAEAAAEAAAAPAVALPPASGGGAPSTATALQYEAAAVEAAARPTGEARWDGSAEASEDAGAATQAASAAPGGADASAVTL